MVIIDFKKLEISFDNIIILLYNSIITYLLFDSLEKGVACKGIHNFSMLTSNHKKTLGEEIMKMSIIDFMAKVNAIYEKYESYTLPKSERSAEGSVSAMTELLRESQGTEGFQYFLKCLEHGKKTESYSYEIAMRKGISAKTGQYLVSSYEKESQSAILGGIL